MVGGPRQKKAVPEETLVRGDCGLGRILGIFEVEPKGRADGLDELKAADAHGGSVGCSHM